MRFDGTHLLLGGPNGRVMSFHDGRWRVESTGATDRIVDIARVGDDLYAIERGRILRKHAPAR